MGPNWRCVHMHLVRGLLRLAVLAAAFALFTLTLSPTSSLAQEEAPACSNGVDDDSDNEIDGADAGCGGGSDDDETDSPYAGIELITIPLPLVTLQGTVDKKGNVNVTRLQVRALRGSTVDITCKGKTCPFKTSRRRMITSSLRLEQLERRLKAPTTLSLRIGRPFQLGKFVQYKLRPNKAPVRRDACLAQDTQEVGPCFVG